MKRHIISRASALALALAAVCGAPLSAQEAFLQIEAHATRNAAAQFASGYASMFGNVVGYRLPRTGWHVIALGPFGDAAQAEALRRALLRERRIPADAFVTDGAGFGERYWPAAEGATAPALLPDAAPASAPGPLVQPQPESESELAPEPDPEETLEEARRSEAALSRDERAEVQAALQWMGIYDLSIDAAFGPGTRSSMAIWQESQRFEPTGVLSTPQREALLAAFRTESAAFGFAPLRDEEAGVEAVLPLGLVAFETREAPFVRYTGPDGVQVLLVSQEGDRAALLGLYDLLQSLEIIPPEGLRQRQGDRFLLTGQDARRRAHAFAELRDGQIKGHVLVWPSGSALSMDRVLARLEESFTRFGPALPGGIGHPDSAVAAGELLAGLEMRRPALSQSGFFIDATGRVLTTAAPEGCGSLTVDGRHGMAVVLHDDARGLMVLEPREALAPSDFARLGRTAPAPRAEVVLAGYPFDDALTRPVLTFGEFGVAEGLDGDPSRQRIHVGASAGDIGGPVLDRTGAVVGMLLPPQVLEGRHLPDGVNFVLAVEAIAEALAEAGLEPAQGAGAALLSSDDLGAMADAMTVRVACWE